MISALLFDPKTAHAAVNKASTSSTISGVGLLLLRTEPNSCTHEVRFTGLSNENWKSYTVNGPFPTFPWMVSSSRNGNAIAAYHYFGHPSCASDTTNGPWDFYLSAST